MNKRILLLLPAVMLLVTGCPRDEYTITLTPHGDKIQREVVFYRGETDTNGVIKYESFPEEDLAAIKACYPSNALSKKGDVYTVKGEFADSTPSDIGGAGNYTNLVTSMGSAGFYGERFRGDDDAIGQVEKRIAAANQLVDVVIGWSKTELGAETNFAQLRKFLDEQFRKDLKNAIFYWRQAAELRQSITNIDEVNGVRFAQYLMERGYLKLADVPALAQMMDQDDDTRFMGFIQRLVARKLSVPDSQPVPASLAFLRDTESMQASFSNYFIGTDLYRSKIKEWEQKAEPAEKKPDVGDIVMGQMLETAGFKLDFFSGNPSDHLKVRLSLPVPPAHTNGKWDEATKVVTWDNYVENGTNSEELPVTCYASWGQPDEPFQKQHFGSVIVTGESLTLYCIWQAGMNQKRAAEWERFLKSLQPNGDLKQTLEGFRFSDEKIDAKSESTSPSRMGRELLSEGLPKGS